MGPYLVLGFLALFGLPLICVGIILRLTEWSWGKTRGSHGATGYLAAGVLLVLPFVLLIAIGYMR